MCRSEVAGRERGRRHKKNLPRENLLVPPRRQLGGRGADGTRRFSLGRFFLCRSEAAGRERGRRHKKNLPREIFLVPPRRQVGGRGAEFHASVPTTCLITKSALPCNNVDCGISSGNGTNQYIVCRTLVRKCLTTVSRRPGGERERQHSLSERARPPSKPAAGWRARAAPASFLRSPPFVYSAPPSSS